MTLPVAAGVTDSVPDAALLPLQPPLAVHDVPVLDDQVSVVDWPSVIVVGEADSDTAGLLFMPLPPPPPLQAVNTAAPVSSDERISSRAAGKNRSIPFMIMTGLLHRAGGPIA